MAKAKIKKDVCELPVMRAHCKTCPFKPIKEGGVLNPQLAAEVCQCNLFKAQQICHGTEGVKREANNRCKGYFDYAFTIYERLGLNPEKHLKNNPE